MFEKQKCFQKYQLGSMHQEDKINGEYQNSYEDGEDYSNADCFWDLSCQCSMLQTTY